nr:immunoglobulin light chain junction region [Macaca mulatta]
DYYCSSYAGNNILF